MSVILVASLTAVPACKKDSDEIIVKRIVRRAVAAANEQSARGVVEDAAETFKGPRNIDLHECRRILMGLFLKKGWLRTFERKLDVTVEGSNAKAILEVAVAEGKKIDKLTDLLPTNATLLEFTIDFTKMDGEWKIVHADYRHVRWDKEK